MWNSVITVNIVVLEYGLVTTVSLHYAEFAKLANFTLGNTGLVVIIYLSILQNNKKTRILEDQDFC
jgi:hypothetical protein